MSLGQFIVIDGGEGATKGSAIELLRKELSQDTVFTREPGGSPLAEKLREIIKGDLGKDANALTLFALFWAARSDHLEKTVRPAIMEGRHVICDRFDISTFAYQLYGEQHFYLLELFEMMRKVYCNPMPSLYIYMDVNVETGLRRSAQAGHQDHFDLKGLEFHRRVREGYCSFLDRCIDNFVLVDANRPKEVVTLEVLEVVRKALA